MRISRNVSVTLKSAELCGLLIFSISTSSPYSLYTRLVFGGTKTPAAPASGVPEPEFCFAGDILFFRGFLEFEELRTGAGEVVNVDVEPPDASSGGSTVLVTMICSGQGFG